jgi:hypothetical protein
VPGAVTRGEHGRPAMRKPEFFIVVLLVGVTGAICAWIYRLLRG